MVHRIAVLDSERCQPRKCGHECIRLCPGVKMGDKTIVFREDGKPLISEPLCTGCGICVKKCPFSAIVIVNLAEELREERIHQYGPNGFRVYRLPILKKGAVVGLVGRNGIGKTTVLNILSGSLKPNLGSGDNPPEWDTIIKKFQGTELKNHFEKISLKELAVSIKPQAVYQISEVWKGDGFSLLKQVDERGVIYDMIEQLQLKESLKKHVRELSGGELQRLAIAACASKDAEVYFFDEPSSFNDVYQRLNVAKVIRDLAAQGKYILLVEHDLTILDYLSEYLHILYGDPGIYGIVTKIMASRSGINILLDGYLPSENVRFRERPVTFDIHAPTESSPETPIVVEHSNIIKKYPGFKLHIKKNFIKEGEVLGILGGNALGKTTFMKIIAGEEKADKGRVKVASKISYKPQYPSSEYEGDVKSLLTEVSRNKIEDSLIQSLLIVPLRINKLYDKQVKELSGGELQKVAIVSCLLREAQIFTLDEPSAFIDVEDRIAISKAIQRFVKSQSRSAMIIDHDIQLIDIVSDRLMIFTGEQGVKGETHSLLKKGEGMNAFLRNLGITYRRDVDTGRPRVNKPGSKLDREQKKLNLYYYIS